MFYRLPLFPPLLHFSAGLFIPPLLNFTAWTPTEWKTDGLGTAQSTLCPILQWIPIYLSPRLLCPVHSLAPCPHLRWGCTAETKEKQPVWEHDSHPHMVLSASPPFCGYISQLYSLVTPLWLALPLTNWKTRRYNAAELYFQECIMCQSYLLCSNTQCSSPAIAAGGRHEDKNSHKKCFWSSETILLWGSLKQACRS